MVSQESQLEKPETNRRSTLSTKERLHLQRRLPCNANAGKVLHRSILGYLIDSTHGGRKQSLGSTRIFIAIFHIS